MLRALVFGWEFAPVLSGGLGVACAGMCRALARQGVGVSFVLPRLPQPIEDAEIRLLSARAYIGVDEVIRVESALGPYDTVEDYRRRFRRSLGEGAGEDLYGGDLFAEVDRLAEAAGRIAAEVPHDVIHCHDWMTFPAGIAARRVSGRPLVVHVHATEHDRSGGTGGNPEVVARERLGLEAADRVVAVSRYTAGLVARDYGIDPERISVVHNGIDPASDEVTLPALAGNRRIVLFLGRITVQKGPEWFLRAARRVLEIDPEVLFVVAGSGDLLPFMIEQSAALGIADRVLFSGFLRGADVERAYAMADVYVMPSVSEPFGLAPLEAMRRGTPVIVSRQSGVSEVVHHCLKVDFWDTEDLADKILGVLRHAELRNELRRRGRDDLERLGWDGAADRLIDLYRDLVASQGVRHA